MGLWSGKGYHTEEGGCSLVGVNKDHQKPISSNCWSFKFSVLNLSPSVTEV